VFLCFFGRRLRAQEQTPSSSEKQEEPTPAKAADETFEEQKKFAFMLSTQNHHLEALPVFQDLAKRKPGDADVLFGFGACLIDHSATAKDEAAGDHANARQMAIRAVVAEPYNKLPWRGPAQWATVNHVKLTPLWINTHKEVASDGSSKSTINWDPNLSANNLVIWMTYVGTRQDWRKEQFKKNFLQESEYRHTLAEEVAALKQGAFMLPKNKLEAVASDPDFALLKKISDAECLSVTFY
jgi:hypothetical protein